MSHSVVLPGACDARILSCWPFLYCGYPHVLASRIVATQSACAGLWPGLTTARTDEMPSDFSEETELDFFTYFYKVR